MAFWQWSSTASADANADPSINWSEGQAPSSVNDLARAMMARLAEFRDDTSGLITTGGTSTAYTVASYQGLNSVPNDGQIVAFSPHTTSGVNPTLTVDGGTTYPLQSSTGTAIAAAALLAGTPYTAKFSVANAAWMLHGFFGNPFDIPLASGMDYWGATVPNSNFAFPSGQAISRTVYAPLFALVGTTYGTGDGTTTFNIPDLRGRVVAALDNMGGSSANRLSGSGLSSTTTLGGSGGSATETISQGNLPNVNLTSGTLSVSWNPAIAYQTGNSGAGANAFQLANTASGNGAGALNPIFAPQFAVSGNVPLGGSGTPLITMQPTIICNYIMRIL